MPKKLSINTLGLLLAAGCLTTPVGAATLYKCISNGQVTYANEPCKGQSMQVVKGNDTNMVQVNSPKSSAPTDADSPEIPVVKLEPKADHSTGPAASLGLGQAAAAQAAPQNGASANERFLAQLQQQTQALTQQAAQASAVPPDWPAELQGAGNASTLPDGFEPLRMPTGEEIVAELRKSWQAELLPQLRNWLAYAMLLLLGSGILALFCLYWVVRLAVKHGILAAQHASHKRAHSPALEALSIPPAEAKH